MKISYHADTNSLYIHLKETPTVESEEVAPDTVLHFDEAGNVNGLEIYWEASNKVDLSQIEVSGIANGVVSKTASSMSLPEDVWAHLVQQHPPLWEDYGAIRLPGVAGNEAGRSSHDNVVVGLQ